MSCRVLVVDDNADFAENIAEILEMEGYDTRIAHDGPSALAYASEHPFDVALVDVRMPGMDGITLYGKLAELRPEATFFLMTAFSTEERLAQGLAAGVRAVLDKPVEVENLLQLLPREPSS